MSDEECKFQMRDRFSFMIFLGLHPGDEVSDARTIWDFKQALEMDGRDGARKLFDRFEQMLTEGGLIGLIGRKGLRREAQKGGKKIVMRAGQRRTTRHTTGTRIT